MTIRRLALGVVLLLSGAALALAQERPATAPPASATPPPSAPDTGIPASPGAGPAAEEGSTVQLEYTLSLEDGEVVDSNRGGEPLTLTLGRRDLIAGVEAALDGMRAGEAKRVTVKPEEGYGHVDPAAQLEVPKDRVPPEVTVGTPLAAQSASGQVRVVRVKEIKTDTVVLDLNHPLAGKTLHFDLRVLDVRTPAK